MLPGNAISIIAETAPYLAPDDIDDENLQSLEEGGVALNDASEGRMVQTWRAWVADGGTKVKLSPLTGSPVVDLVTGAVNITSVSVAFDTSMAPTLCYIEGGVLKLRWFNTLTSEFQTDTYAGATSARVSTDDKRSSQESVSDVIFAYTRGSVLYYRQERDRYTIEYTVGPSGTLKLHQLGMNEKYRMQFKLTVG